MLSACLLMAPFYDFAHLRLCDYTSNVTQAVTQIPRGVPLEDLASPACSSAAGPILAVVLLGLRSYPLKGDDVL